MKKMFLSGERGCMKEARIIEGKIIKKATKRWEKG